MDELIMEEARKVGINVKYVLVHSKISYIEMSYAVILYKYKLVSNIC